MAVPQIDNLLTPDELNLLGSEMMAEIRAVESGRSQITERYLTWVDNYEGNVAPAESEKPWTGASDAHIPKTATDVDIAYARCMNAVFGQFPRWMILPMSDRWASFAGDTQKLSEYVEQQEIPIYKVLSQAFLILVKFGTVVIYNPWENRPMKWHTLDPEGTSFVEEDADEFDRPNPAVIHPKDFLLPIHCMDIQQAPWCGYKYKMRLGQLRLWRDSGFFLESAAERLEAEFSGASQRGEPEVRTPVAHNVVDRVQEERERTAGLSRSKSSDELDMVHIFARRDIDGDGVEEEINFHLHVDSGIVARITYSHYRHRRRPFIDLHFFPRDGIWYSIGIPEMLENVQRNIDVTFRQIQDNNTVKNTQSFRATLNGAIGPNEPFHPAKIYFVRPGEEFEPLRMGDQSFNTSMTDLQLLMQEGDKRTGLPDSAAGVGQDRQTATAALALLQEASRRIDLIIGGIRDQLGEWWMQTLELYAQFKPVMEFPDATGVLVQWHYESGEAFRRRVMVKPTMSTAALNKAILRQELEGLEQQLIAYAQVQLQLANAFLQAVDPALKMYIAKTAEGLHLVMERTLQTFEFAKDTKAILPAPALELPNVAPGQPPLTPPPSGGGSQPAGPMAAPQGLLPNPGAGSAPATAPGRPGPEVGLPQSGRGPGGAAGAP